MCHTCISALINVIEPLCCRWEFMTEDYDISFGIFYSNDNKSNVEVVPLKRTNCHMIPDEGHVICQNPGTCEYRDYLQE